MSKAFFPFSKVALGNNFDNDLNYNEDISNLFSIYAIRIGAS